LASADVGDELTAKQQLKLEEHNLAPVFANVLLYLPALIAFAVS